MSVSRGLLTVLLMMLATTALASQSKHYDFKVYLDEAEIGQHRFVVTSGATQTTISSEARFDVKFLFITVYTYLHSNKEVWQGDCLHTINATTNDNGVVLFVRGDHHDQSLTVQTREGTKHLKGCVRTFAYWDPYLIRTTQLLNAQTGELLPVTVESLGDSTIRVRGEPIVAQQYRITNPKMSIDLWYSSRQEWLALESTTENGARLRYLVQ